MDGWIDVAYYAIFVLQQQPMVYELITWLRNGSKKREAIVCHGNGRRVPREHAFKISFGVTGKHDYHLPGLFRPNRFKY